MAKSNGSVSLRKRSGGIEDVGARVEVRRHPGARRLTLRVSRTQRAVIVTLPLQCDLDEAGSFLSRHIDWVRERLDSLPDPVPFAHGMAMPLRGEPHDIVFTGATRTRLVSVQPGQNNRREISVPGSLDSAPQRLRNWLVDEAKRDLDGRVTFHAKRLNVQPKRIAVRDQASRWGSCSTTRVLSFSWRLLLAPPAILDYVAAHEVAHLAEMNHGPRFWALVRKTLPDYESAKRWLQVYGLDLHRYGVSAFDEA
ncbi:MAG: M48 family metallopeptidase [Hyphomicrobium sp.]